MLDHPTFLNIFKLHPTFVGSSNRVAKRSKHCPSLVIPYVDSKLFLLFLGEKFYRFDSRHIKVVRNYPKRIRNEFAICKVPSKSSKLSDVVGSYKKPSNAASLALQSLTSILVAISAFIIQMS